MKKILLSAMTVLLGMTATAQTAIDCDFESGALPEGWTKGVPESPYKGGYSVVKYADESALKVANVGANENGGTYCLKSVTGGLNNTKGNSDNWLISPEVTIGDANILSFRLAANCSYSPYFEDTNKMQMDVLVINGTDTATVTTITPVNYFTWKQYAIDLSAYKGKSVQIAFHDYGITSETVAKSISDMKYIDNVQLTANQTSDYSTEAVTTLHGQAELSAPYTIKVSNYGLSQGRFMACYQMNDDIIKEAVESNIGAGQSVEYTFKATPEFTPGTTTYFRAWAEGTYDAINANDSLEGQDIVASAVQALPYSAYNTYDEDSICDDAIQTEFNNYPYYANYSSKANCYFYYDPLKYNAWIFSQIKSDDKYVGAAYLCTSKAFILRAGKVKLTTIGTATLTDMKYEVYVAKYGSKTMADYGTKVGESEIMRDVPETGGGIDTTSVELTIPEDGNYIIGIRPINHLANAQMTLIGFSLEEMGSEEPTSGFHITASVPAAGECAGIAKSSYWEFASNMDADDNLKAISYEFVDKTTGSTLYTSTCTKASKYVAADGMWEIKNYSTGINDFKKGHKIVLYITALDNEVPTMALAIGKDSICWTGTGSADYVYSPAKLVSVTPETGSEIKSKNDNTFVLTFSQPVRVDKNKSEIVTGQMSSAGFQSITVNEDSTQWTLVVKPSTIEATSPQLYINVYVTDQNGLTLEGNTSGAYQLEDKSYYKLKYECYIGSPAMVIEPAAGVVESLQDFKISYNGGIDLSYAAGVPDISITKETGETVATVKQSDLVVDAKNNLFVTFSLPTAITTSGTYTLNIPSKLFALGTEFDGYTSKAQTVTYTVEAAALSADITPADSTELETMPNISVTFSDMTAVGYANYVITDLNPDDPENPIIMSGDLKINADGTAFVTKYLSMYDIKLYKGHRYEISVKAYATEMDYNYGNEPMAVFTSTIKGATVPFEYSSVTLETLTPADGSTIKTGEITAVYTDAVASITATINGGFSDNVTCTTTPANDGNKTWTITIPESVINAATGSINVNVVAKDAEGKYLKGNSYADPDTTTVWSFNCYNGCPAPETIEPASGSKVESLSVITLSDSKGINLAYAATSNIMVTKGKEWICDVPMDSVKVEAAALGSASTCCAIHLPQTITEAGNYQVIIPALYFILGEDANTVMTREMVLEYTIEAEAPVEEGGIIVDPAAGTVKTLKDFTFSYTNGGMLSPSSNDLTNLTITNAAGEVVATITQEELSQNVVLEGEGWDAYPVATKVSLAEPITTPGVYTLNIPEAAFYVGDNFDNSKATTFVYTVEGEEPPTGINNIATTSATTLYNLAGQKVSKARKGIFIKNGKKIAVK